MIIPYTIAVLIVGQVYSVLALAASAVLLWYLGGRNARQAGHSWP